MGSLGGILAIALMVMACLVCVRATNSCATLSLCIITCDVFERAREITTRLVLRDNWQLLCRWVTGPQRRDSEEMGKWNPSVSATSQRPHLDSRTTASEPG